MIMGQIASVLLNCVFLIILKIYFIKFTECDRKCGTCLSPSGNCDVFCDSNCGYCETDGKCKACLMGYYLDPATKSCD